MVLGSKRLVYPNPVINNLTVEFETTDSETDVEAYSSRGQLMFIDNKIKEIGSNKVLVDMTEYSSGIYLLRIGNMVKKIVK